ncbi:MAG: hypothetical protein ACREAC_15975, partial [Blastocatellia bacterium]
GIRCGCVVALFLARTGFEARVVNCLRKSFNLRINDKGTRTWNVPASAFCNAAHAFRGHPDSS